MCSGAVPLRRMAVPGHRPELLQGDAVGRPQIDLLRHGGQVELGLQRAGVVEALLGLLDDGVYRGEADAERAKVNNRDGRAGQQMASSA